MKDNGSFDAAFDELRRVERIVLALLVAVNIGFPSVLIAAAWPRPWRPFSGEDAAINWLSTVQCALIGAISLSVWAASRIGRRAGTDGLSRSWPWLLFCGGFLAMALDERFKGHETIREEILKPRGWFTGFDFMLPGDVALIGYVLVGALLGWYLLPELRRVRFALAFFVCAILLIGISAVQDSLVLDLSSTARHAQSILEELAEVWAQMLFALSFLLVLFDKLRRFAIR